MFVVSDSEDVENSGEEVEIDGEEVESDGENVETLESSRKEVKSDEEEVESDMEEVESDGEDVESDGEEVESDREELESNVKEEDCYRVDENARPPLRHTPWKVSSATPSCSTSYTGVMFWGSPDTDCSSVAKSKPKCTPLVARNRVYLTTPVAG